MDCEEVGFTKRLMPKRKVDMFEVVADEGERVKLPTLRQWLKEQPQDDFNAYHQVRLIWLPGNWPNYTLETSAFRAIVTDRNPLYAALRDGLDSFTTTQRALGLRIVDPKRVTFSLLDFETPGDWFFIGGVSGLRWDGPVVEPY